ncbi:Ig-like domain-containing protein [Anaerovorax odorimutans]|uniref:Ig-like domain-containing protein n=1 Tax=Anaerovorax odorimutans TaxID=109327 RepID=UPI000486FBE3|nr:Ig-like domain-containing protein [Anaerovorax odorimutans]
MLKSKISIKIFRQIMLILCLIFSLTILANAEDGNGNGGGENRDIPVGIVSSNVADGQVDVPVDININLEFNKNVINISVAENNKSCFSLEDENGNNIDISIAMGDDQIDPTVKRLITVVPKENLEAGIKYTLTISENFTAKNGVSLEKPISLTFTTLKENIINETSDKNLTNSQNVTESSMKVTKESLSVTKAGISEDKKDTQKVNMIKILSIVSIIISFILLIVYFIMRRNIKE